jgi:hypothetical protein
LKIFPKGRPARQRLRRFSCASGYPKKQGTACLAGKITKLSFQGRPLSEEPAFLHFSPKQVLHFAQYDPELIQR